MKTLEQVQLETEMAIRAKNGDEDAFMFLVKQYEEMIYKFVHKFHYLKYQNKNLLLLLLPHWPIKSAISSMIKTIYIH